MKFAQLVNRLQEFSLQPVELLITERGATEVYVSRVKGRKPVVMTAAQVKSTCFLIERLMPKAEAPKDLNVTGQLVTVVKIGDPTQRPEGYERRGKASQ